MTSSQNDTTNASLHNITRGWALDRVHNSRRPLDRLRYVFFTFWTWPLIFWPQKAKIISSVGYPKVILRHLKFEHFEIIRFWAISYQTHKHTASWRDAAKHFAPATVVGVSNETFASSRLSHHF